MGHGRSVIVMKSNASFLLSSLPGQTALITGASSGIGRSIAIQLAPSVSRIILVSRNRSAMESVAEEIRGIANTHIDIKAFDLSEGSSTMQLIQWIESNAIQVDLMVLSAGRSWFGAFQYNSVNDYEQMLELLNGSNVKLLKALLPGMTARKKGGILFISSLYAFTPAPFQALYSASKAFMTSLAESIRVETRGQGIKVTTVFPGTTATAFRRDIGETQPTGMCPDKVATLALNGWARGAATVIPGWKNYFLYLVMGAIPRNWRPRWAMAFNQRRGVNRQNPNTLTAKII